MCLCVCLCGCVCVFTVYWDDHLHMTYSEQLSIFVIATSHEESLTKQIEVLNLRNNWNEMVKQAEFDFRVLTSAECEIAKKEKPEDGSYVEGLFMEGASWNANQHAIAESNPR